MVMIVDFRIFGDYSGSLHDSDGLIIVSKVSNESHAAPNKQRFKLTLDEFPFQPIRTRLLRDPLQF